MRRFLTTSRPHHAGAAGLPVYGGRSRRVSGDGGEEIALLAGISVEYNTRVERGHLDGEPTI
jgi:hypothetical protein